MRRQIWLGVAVVAAALALRGRGCGCAGAAGPPRVRIATFNIEHFPRDDEQVRRAFDEIEGLGVDLVAVQEITDPDRFERVAERRLGDWGFVHTGVAPGMPGHRLGLVYDRSRWLTETLRIHPRSDLDRRCQPVLDVELRPASGEGRWLRVLVVHLRPTTEGRALRVREHERLRRLAASVRRPEQDLVILGDFNATEDADRVDLAALARAADLHWASEGLRCTAFWRRDRDCPTSRLDHVLTSAAPGSVRARGVCERQGCETRRTCPSDALVVSDHCPVTVDTR
jgi:endonuclease/exonuclease/phosphatase family metal-dependent hydrolase